MNVSQILTEVRLKSIKDSPETFVYILRASKLNKEKKQYKKKVSDKEKHRVGEVQEPPGEINNTG